MKKHKEIIEATYYSKHNRLLNSHIRDVSIVIRAHTNQELENIVYSTTRMKLIHTVLDSTHDIRFLDV